MHTNMSGMFSIYIHTHFNKLYLKVFNYLQCRSWLDDQSQKINKYQSLKINWLLLLFVTLRRFNEANERVLIQQVVQALVFIDFHFDLITDHFQLGSLFNYLSGFSLSMYSQNLRTRFPEWTNVVNYSW